MLSYKQCFILFSSFPFLLDFDVGGLVFEFCVFVAGWRHDLRSEWPFIIIILMHTHDRKTLIVPQRELAPLAWPVNERCSARPGTSLGPAWNQPGTW